MISTRDVEQPARQPEETALGQHAQAGGAGEEEEEEEISCRDELDPHDRPIRPAGEVLLRAFAGENVASRRSGMDSFSGDEDEDDIELARQDFENALLGLSPEAGVVGGLEDDFARDDGLNELDAEALIQRSAAEEGGGGLEAGIAILLPRTAYAGSNGTECAVCISELEKGQEVTCLPCGHLFHTVCILRCFQKEGRCPCCRETLTREGLLAGGSNEARGA